MTDDGALVARYLRTRRERDFAELYRSTNPALWRLALRLARGHRAEADDLVADTWLRAVRRLDSFRSDARLGPWLAGIAWNCWRERVRGAGRETPWPAHGALAGADPPRHEEHLDLRAALDALPDGYRTVLLLHDLEGYTHAEIGAALGVSAGTSKSQLSRARATLRRILGVPAPVASESTTAAGGPQ